MSIPRPNGRGSRDRINVPCGKCPACLQNKRASWGFRLSQELKSSETASFVTLTYDEKNNMGSLSKNDVTLFLKRLRQACIKMDIQDDPYYESGLNHPKKSKLRYFITGEYGSNTFRPHYHMLLFNHPLVSEMELYELINKTWKKGSSYIGQVTEASIAYVAKYLLKGSVTPEGCEEPFSFMSRKPGIGIEYVERMSDWHHEDIERMYVVKPGGIKQNLPRYYKDKIYSDNTKEKYAESQKLKMDEKEKELLYEQFRKGENPFHNELLKKQDLKRKMDIKIKNGKL